jgi:hypothetical protein
MMFDEDGSKAVFVGTISQLLSIKADSVQEAGGVLPVAEDFKSLGVTWRSTAHLTFDRRDTAVLQQ